MHFTRAKKNDNSLRDSMGPLRFFTPNGKTIRTTCLIVFLLASCKDNIPPSNFSITINIISSTKVKISWTESIDPEGDIVIYNLLLDDAPILLETRLLTYTFDDLDESKTYSCRLIASDGDGNRTEKSFSINTSEFKIEKKYDGYTAVHFVWNNILIDDKEAVYDVYWSGVLSSTDDHTSKMKLYKENLEDESLIISNLPAETSAGCCGFYYKLQIHAKGDNSEKVVDYYYYPKVLYKVKDESITFYTYNVSDDSIEFYLHAFSEYYTAPKYSIFVDNQLEIVQNGCSYPGNPIFPAIKNLSPNTTYNIRATVEFPNDPYDPNYELVSFVSSKEKNITTYVDQIPSQISIKLNNITANRATVNWRVKVVGRNCYPGPVTEKIKVYLNNSLMTTRDALLEEYYVLEELNANTLYEVKVSYEVLTNNGTLISSQNASLTFSTL
jgi:hypothetical protein